jgi:cytochrome c oxidase cbb3-type subunit 3
MMRNGVLLVAGLLIVALAAGCRREFTTVAAGGPASTTDPVGPVPGGIQPTHFRTNPFTSDPVALQDGRRLFNWYNCSGCHGGHAGGGMGPSLRDPVWLYGDRDDQVFDSIAQGRSQGMPAWGSKIPELQIWELVAYIKSMGTPQEPEPPTEPSDEMVVDPQHNTKDATGTKTMIVGAQ